MEFTVCLKCSECPRDGPIIVLPVLTSDLNQLITRTQGSACASCKKEQVNKCKFVYLERFTSHSEHTFQITLWSSNPKMRCSSSLENVTESISVSCPPSTGESCVVLSCSTSQILISPSLDPDVTYLSSYKNATDKTQSLSGECPNEHCTCLHFPSSNCFVHQARHDLSTVKQEHDGCHSVCVPAQAPMTNSSVPESHISTLSIGGP